MVRKRWGMTFVERLLFRYGSNKSRIRILRRIDMQIGESCIVPRTVCLGSEPFLIKLGNRVRLADEAMFITRQGATWVFRNQIKVTSFGSIFIGDNCFIGARSIILPDVKIGKNCIIAAGSVVTKNCEANGVYGGNPAKYITSLDDYRKRRIERSLDLPTNLFERKRELIKIFWEN